MDLATLIGMLGAIGVILLAIVIGGGAGGFVDVPSLLIVIGGGLFANLIKFPLSDTLGAFKVAGRAFTSKPAKTAELIAECVDLATRARKEGILALESVEVSNPFLKKGIQMVIDGQKPDVVSRALAKDMNLAIERHESGQAVFKGLGDSAPAMGMIGTLVGLVQMMSNMSDPAAIGPAMAVALLTTLYGAVIANTICLPMAEKLAYRGNEERRHKGLIIDAISGLQDGMNPRVLESLLLAYLPSGKRESASASGA